MKQYKDIFKSTDSANVIGKNTRDGKNANPAPRKKVIRYLFLTIQTLSLLCLGHQGKIKKKKKPYVMVQLHLAGLPSTTTNVFTDNEYMYYATVQGQFSKH
jgi:hypothetical protein